MARAPPRMNIAAPLPPQGARGLYGCAHQKRASLLVAAAGLAVALFALTGLWSAQRPTSWYHPRADCVVPYSDSSSMYGRCDQSCDNENGGGTGKTEKGGSGGRGREVAEGLRSRVVDLGRAKAKTAGPYWVAVVGDSIARNTLIALMQVSGIDMDTVTFERHQDFERLDPAANIRWTLHWAPFPRNASGVVTRWVAGLDKKLAGKSPMVQWPDAVVVSTSLWHVLWEHDVDAYREDVRGLVRSLGELIELRPGMAPILLNGPFVFGELLEDAQKRTYMVEERIVAYNAALQQEVCGVTGHGGSARGVHPGAETRRLKLVDVFGVTAGCGVGCSMDGIHSQEHVYGERVVPMVLDGFGTSP